MKKKWKKTAEGFVNGRYLIVNITPRVYVLKCGNDVLHTGTKKSCEEKAVMDHSRASVRPILTHLAHKGIMNLNQFRRALAEVVA